MEVTKLVDIVTIIIGALVSVLLGTTSYAALEYYRRLHKAQQEYEKAKEVIEDIVLSFNRELKREAERIESVTYKAENACAKADASLRFVENFDSRIEPLENQVLHIGTQIDAVKASVNVISENNEKAIEKISDIDFETIGTISNMDSKMRDIETSQDELKSKITHLETRIEELQKLPATPDIKNESAPVNMPVPVMPIKRDKAMASLTETEVTVLEFLSFEGPKSAPEIKEKVGLSREHTSRLMKKLYEEGYLERETGKLPFKYSAKKEMEKLLKKPEQSTAAI